MHTLPAISAAVADIQAGRLSPRDLVLHCLGQIRHLDAEIRAWVIVDEERALRDADRLGQLARDGRCLGPLHGIPIGIKDLVDVAGLPTKAGSPLRDGHLATADAPLIARLREAGAIILGKTVTTEFACFDPPPTRNPRNVARTPGGSSSGSAAAVAAGMCPAAIGSQTGGSIIRPASFCGVPGFKPTFGAVSTEAVVPISGRLDHVGPIARTVGDLAAVFAALTGSVNRLSPRTQPPRLGRLGGIFRDQADPAVACVTEQAFARLRDRGANVIDVAPPASFADVATMHGRIMAVDAAVYHREPFAAHRTLYGPKVSSLITAGQNVSGIEYALALEHQPRFQRDLRACFADCDALVMPSTVTTAPGPESTGDPAFNAPWSYAGFPAVTIPCGDADDGLPCGLQLVGLAASDWDLLAVAEWCATM